MEIKILITKPFHLPFQYLTPVATWLGPPPAAIMIPRMIRPTIVKILILANQNSASPYALAPNKLMVTTTTKQRVIQTALLMEPLVQYPISTAAADNSAGRTITQLYLIKKFSMTMFKLTIK